MAQLIAKTISIDGNINQTEFDMGAAALLDLWIYDGGVPADPTAVATLKSRDPTGTASAAVNMTKVAVGHYSLALPVAVAGTYKGTVLSGSPHPGATDVTWTVRERAVP